MRVTVWVTFMFQSDYSVGYRVGYSVGYRQCGFQCGLHRIFQSELQCK